MNYWAICVPRDAMEQCIKLGIFGLSRNFLLGRMQHGDKVMCCTSKEWKIVAHGVVTEPYYLDDSEVFDKELFPHRVGFRANRCEERSLPDLVSQFSFVKDPGNWWVHFRSGVTRISKEDWELVFNGRT